MISQQRRVVITGIGIISCIGNSFDAVTRSLLSGHSGVRPDQDFATNGMRSIMSGKPDISQLPQIARKSRRFMGDAAVYAYHATEQAIQDSALSADQLMSPMTGIAVGSGVGSPHAHFHALETLKNEGLHKVPPYIVPIAMGSTVSANLATAFGIHGISCGISSACATSGHNIGYAYQLIQFGKQDVMIAGGAEEASWTSASMFDAMGALSIDANTRASRPFDASRNGFIYAGGAGIVILEALEHAINRGANIYAELTGFGASSDGMSDMVTPSPDGAARAMSIALAEHCNNIPNPLPINYINAHATSTQAGDINELIAIRKVFGDQIPNISSTRGLTGHPIGASAAHELIYTLAMMKHQFITGNHHIGTIDKDAKDFPIILENQPGVIWAALSNSFGFGGTNVSLTLQKYT